MENSPKYYLIRKNKKEIGYWSGEYCIGQPVWLNSKYYAFKMEKEEIADELNDMISRGISVEGCELEEQNTGFHLGISTSTLLGQSP